MLAEISNPSDDPQLQELRREQNRAHEEIRSNSEIVKRFKAQREAAQHVLAGNQRHAPTRDEEEKAKAASRAVRAAQSKLRDLEVPLRDARAAACKRIVAEVRPEYLKLLGEFALAYLRNRADELVAIERVLAMRGHLNAMQISLATLPIPPFERNAERTDWKYAVIREDTKALIDLGAIKAGDLPRELAKAWGLK